MAILSIQTAFDKDIPDQIRGNSEYLTELEILQNIDRLLRDSAAEDLVIQDWLAQAEKAAAPKKLSLKAKRAIQANAVFALRAAVLRKYRNLSYRDFARELARAPLYQWFCGINRWGKVRIPGKSKLQACEQALPETLLRDIEKCRLTCALAESGQGGTLGTEEKLDLSACFFDTFCLEANIHYPVDWLLLRDASRTLMLAVTQIRKHGIVNRMAADCQSFVTKMNRLCIQMTHSVRRKGGKKIRKRCFRERTRANHRRAASEK